MADDLATLIRQSAGRLGIDPSDLATAISYETGGKMDPNIWGGSGGRHLGLIQFGPEEQAKYGVKPGMPVPEHMGAVENFLRDRGVRPGMGMLDIYSTINAGRPGLYNRTDANNGGAPGTVADKVANQMVAHRLKANALLGGEYRPNVAPQPVAVAQTGPAAAPVASTGLNVSAADLAPGPGGEDNLLASLQRLTAGMTPQEDALPRAQMQQAISIPGVARRRMARARAIAGAVRKNPLMVRV